MVRSGWFLANKYNIVYFFALFFFFVIVSAFRNKIQFLADQMLLKAVPFAVVNPN